MTQLRDLLIPVVTIVGLVVLLALGKIDQTAGLALLGSIAVVHGGAQIANAVTSSNSPPPPVVPDG